MLTIQIDIYGNNFFRQLSLTTSYQPGNLKIHTRGIVLLWFGSESTVRASCQK